MFARISLICIYSACAKTEKRIYVPMLSLINFQKKRSERFRTWGNNNHSLNHHILYAYIIENGFSQCQVTFSLNIVVGKETYYRSVIIIPWTVEFNKIYFDAHKKVSKMGFANSIYCIPMDRNKSEKRITFLKPTSYVQTFSTKCVLLYFLIKYCSLPTFSSAWLVFI